MGVFSPEAAAFEEGFTGEPVGAGVLFTLSWPVGSRCAPIGAEGLGGRLVDEPCSFFGCLVVSDSVSIATAMGRSYAVPDMTV
ncbi:hypothetical protein GCM10010387_58970 [Streptomyces inusitatus]|uniref:Uncharacterized protein n=1 Tax=Streptomyces inusitatus TaxID=68221 RepID=A0A918QMU3_9ACTN|nr:hypothetical protein [Streptomyces inusitatus]GGZ57233.1 hypothetical protein GCM10010387_58970 [Streptomyces inusitatus]